MLAVSAGIAVTGAVLAAGAADAGQLSASRRTTLRRRVLTGGHLRVSRCQTISHLGLTWQGARARVRFRTGAGWSQWITIDGCPAASERERTPRNGAVIVSGAASGYEVSLTGNADVFEISTPTSGGP